jgi:hypothetical protein
MKKQESIEAAIDRRRSRRQDAEHANKYVSAVPGLDALPMRDLRSLSHVEEAELRDLEEFLIDATSEERIELENRKARKTEWLAKINQEIATRPPEPDPAIEFPPEGPVVAPSEVRLNGANFNLHAKEHKRTGRPKGESLDGEKLKRYRREADTQDTGINTKEVCPQISRRLLVDGDG